MDRFSWLSLRTCGVLALLALTATTADAQRSPRTVYNPVTGRTEVEHRGAAAPSPMPASPAPRRDEAVQPVCHGEPCGCGDHGCTEMACDADLCGEVVCGETVCGPRAACYAGFEFTFVKPRFENNVAFTVTESDGVGNDVITDTEFDHDLELTPRVFLGWRHGDGVGMRVTWWHFDHEAQSASANPPANGFGSITHPAFGTVDISSVDPSEQVSAASSLNAYTIDLEATKETRFCGWDLGVAGGVRYAFSEQTYLAQTTNSADTLLGQIDYKQSIEGFGPTISLYASRPLTRQASLYWRGRGSLLFGDGESRLEAGEDLDLTAPFSTTRSTNRDDLLSIAEMQLGFRWQGKKLPHRRHIPFATFAMEGQVWNGAGNATSEEGTIGFFGFATSVGFDW